MTGNPRAEAARILVAVLQRGRSLNDALPSAASPLLKELVYGVVRWYWRLAEYAEELLDSPLRKRDADLMALILIGLYLHRKAYKPLVEAREAMAEEEG